MGLGYNLSRCRVLKCRDRGHPYNQILMEDEQQTPRTSQAPHLRRICDLPKRSLHRVPGEQSFRPIDVVTNHYEVKLSRNMSRLVVYRVKITPSIPADNRSLRKNLFDRIAFDLETFIGTLCPMQASLSSADSQSTPPKSPVGRK
jgi:hypothetical protein